MTLLLRKSYQLVNMAHRPRTRSTYSRQFKVFLAFACFMDVQDLQNIDLILCFLTCLHENGISAASTAGYLAAVKHNFVVYGLDVSIFENKLISLLQKSFAINAPIKIRQRGIIDIKLLQEIILACDNLQYPIIYKSIFLLAFFTFLRISNFAPLSVSQFDTSRHLTRGDVVWGHPGAHIIIKWAKNMQERKECHVIQIPHIKNTLLCPVKTLHSYFKKYPHGFASPMFVNPLNSLPITQSNIRQALANISKILNIPPGYITFHCFRRSGATFAFNHNVALQNIQHHGAWKSQAVWLYLTQSHQGTARVAAAFSKHVL